jgi:hypothetical protein
VVSVSVSFLCSLLLWKHISLALPYALVSVGASLLLIVFLFQLRFLPHMTVTVWTKLWGVFGPFLIGSLFALPSLPTFPLLVCLLLLTIAIGIWAAYRFYPLLTDTRLHKSRFARIDEMETLLLPEPCSDGLLLGSVKQIFFLRRYVCVRPTQEKKEIGHSLIIAPTGGGKSSMNKGHVAVAENLAIS